MDKRWKSNLIFPILVPWRGGDVMRIEVKIDTTCSEPKVVIVTDKMTDEINDVLKKLSETAPHIIVGFRADTAEPVSYTHLVCKYEIYKSDRDGKTGSHQSADDVHGGPCK